MIERLFPNVMERRFGGPRAALWLLGLLVALKAVMGTNMILFTARIASTADGFPLASYGAGARRAVLMLFAMVGLGQLVLAAIGLIALLRYRAMVPLAFLLLAAEQIGRIAISRRFAIDRAEAVPAGVYVNLALLLLLVAGLALALRRGASRTAT